MLIRPGGIGDCVLSFPAMQWLRGAEYTEIWTRGDVGPLISFADKVRNITLMDGVGYGNDAHVRQRLEQFDSIISWYGYARPDLRECLAYLPIEFLPALPAPDSALHAIDFFCDQVGAPLGGRPGLDFGAVKMRNTAIVHPFSGGPKKNWPLENFRKVAARLPMPVEWIAGPEEELAGALRFDDLSELAKWIAAARIYIGNDSGITHIAAATGVPTVAIFRHSDARIWAPRGPNVTVLSSADAIRFSDFRFRPEPDDTP